MSKTNVMLIFEDCRLAELVAGQPNADAAYLEAIKQGIVDIAGDIEAGVIKSPAVHVISKQDEFKLKIVQTDTQD